MTKDETELYDEEQASLLILEMLNNQFSKNSVGMARLNSNDIKNVASDRQQQILSNFKKQKIISSLLTATPGTTYRKPRKIAWLVKSGSNFDGALQSYRLRTTMPLLVSSRSYDDDRKILTIRDCHVLISKRKIETKQTRLCKALFHTKETVEHGVTISELIRFVYDVALGTAEYQTHSWRHINNFVNEINLAVRQTPGLENIERLMLCNSRKVELNPAYMHP
jgi:hypothetical protein